MKVRELMPGEQRIADAVARKLLELDVKQVRRPTHVAVHRTLFLGVGELLGLKLVRVGYIREDEAALLLKTDDVARYVPSVAHRIGTGGPGSDDEGNCVACGEYACDCGRCLECDEVTRSYALDDNVCGQCRAAR